MSSQQQTPRKTSSFYPEVIQTNPDSSSTFIIKNPSSSSSSSSSMYPSVDPKDLAEKLFPDNEEEIPVHKGSSKNSTSGTFDSSEQVIIRIPGAIVHLIDKEQSVELAAGEFSIVQLKQGGNVVAALARVGDEIQWPLARDEPAVKLDGSHYFFSLRAPSKEGVSTPSADNILNYGLTIAAKGQDGLLRELDSILEKFSAFRVEKTTSEVVRWGAVAEEVSPDEMASKKDELERSASAYWTTLAPNVEDYSGSIAKLIASGSGQVIRGILWCGDVTVDRLKWGNEFLMKRVGKGSTKVSDQAMRRMKRVKDMTKMSENVATGILSGVVKVSGFFTRSVVNSKVGQKFFNLLPGEIVLASLDGFNKICDAVEVTGKNVMSTTSVVSTGLVSQRYGEEAGQVTQHGFGAAGHAIGTAWAVFKIRKALNPKASFSPSSLAKATAKANAVRLKSSSSKN